MINKIKSIWRNFQRSKVYLDASIDHIELAEDYLILGLNLCWDNRTPDPLSIQEVWIKLFHKDHRKEPVELRSQGHFMRVQGQKVITKTLGAKTFLLPAGKTHEEHIRFFTCDLLNLDPGEYPVEVHAIVPGGTYMHLVHLHVINRLKYRTSEAWTMAAEKSLI